MRLLYIEDDTTISSAFIEILKSEFDNIKIDLFDDFDNSKQAIKNNKYDIIVTDCNINGGSACELIPLIDINIPVIITTGYTSKSVPRDNMVLLTKPFSISTFISTIKNLLNR